MLFVLSKFVALKTATATIFTVFIYLAIVIITAWQDAPRPPPEHTEDVDLSQAFQDLKFVRNVTRCSRTCFQLLADYDTSTPLQQPPE